jgi:hypothetical protein
MAEVGSHALRHPAINSDFAKNHSLVLFSGASPGTIVPLLTCKQEAIVFRRLGTVPAEPSLPLNWRRCRGQLRALLCRKRLALAMLAGIRADTVNPKMLRQSRLRSC